MNKQIPLTSATPRTSRKAKGFTLIELVVAMVIAAILAAIAIPAYSNYVRKSRRTEAKTALLDLASLEERYFSTSNTYSGTATDVGYAAWPSTIGSGYYSIAAPNITAAVAPTPAAPAGTPAFFSFVATPLGDQVKDTQCASFTVTSQGSQTAANSVGVDNTATCWH